jgi:hypothetical protein
MAAALFISFICLGLGGKNPKWVCKNVFDAEVLPSVVMSVSPSYHCISSGSVLLVFQIETGKCIN